MKAILTLALVVLSAQAFASRWIYESHYGELTLVDGKYICTLTNTKNEPLYIGKVQFNFERRAGKNREIVETKKVFARNEQDTGYWYKVLWPGKTIIASSDATAALIGESCKFLAR